MLSKLEEGLVCGQLGKGGGGWFMNSLKTYWGLILRTAENERGKEGLSTWG